MQISDKCTDVIVDTTTTVSDFRLYRTLWVLKFMLFQGPLCPIKALKPPGKVTTQKLMSGGVHVSTYSRDPIPSRYGI